MFISLRVSLKDGVTLEDAVSIAQVTAIDLQREGNVAKDDDLYRFIDRVYYHVQEGDGNDLGM